ncbi:replication initiation protein (plasmid) [Planococcus glaciei]|nr:replication initiation protein [Planococcus glaciei]
MIALSFSPKLKPYLLQLKNAFTSYRLSNILSLKVHIQFDYTNL